MVGRIVWAYTLVMCGQLLLCPAHWLATAMPTPDNEAVYDNTQGNNATSNVTTGVQTQWSFTAAVPTPDNETVNNNPLGKNQTSNVTTGVIWEITETAGNKTEEDSDGLLFRGGWTSKNQNSNLHLESEEGWLNSALIAKDAFIPYRTVGSTNRLGNSSEEWKNLLVKPEAHENQRHGRVTKVEINEKRDIPFQYRWRVNT